MRIGAHTTLDDFAEIWCADFEFTPQQGEIPIPVCLVAREARSGRTVRVWQDELQRLREPPFPTGGRALFVAYYVTAELSCFGALGWHPPKHILDLCIEFRCIANGYRKPKSYRLIDALPYYGLPALSACEKKEMQDLAIGGGPFPPAEQAGLLDYCESDVDSLVRLLPRMSSVIDLPRALLRGRAMSAVARMEAIGVPLDLDLLNDLRANWEQLKLDLIREIDADYGVYEETKFKLDRFAEWLVRQNLPWPRTRTGLLSTAKSEFRAMAKLYPQVAPLHELRVTLSQLRLEDLAVGRDGRNRCAFSRPTPGQRDRKSGLGPFSSKTGRNQPGSTRYIFGPAKWIRGLIRPDPGMALAYIDYEQQEFGIAAALSEDGRMMQAYQTGDPYLALAKQAGVIPDSATKATHPRERGLFKQATLAVQYGQGARGLAERSGIYEVEASSLLGHHRRTYSVYWRWIDAVLATAYNRDHFISTVFGWGRHLDLTERETSVQNHPMQANGAEMLRLATVLGFEAGIRICGPVHDALLIESPRDQIEEAVATTQKAMARASSWVLGGFELRTEAEIVRWPERYMDDRGRDMWQTVMKLLARANPKKPAPEPPTNPCSAGTLPDHRSTPALSPISTSLSTQKGNKEDGSDTRY